MLWLGSNGHRQQRRSEPPGFHRDVRSVYNLLNSQTVVNVHSRYESTPGAEMPYFGQGTVWQSPRYTQLVVTWNF